jgi:hypothetical protein
LNLLVADCPGAGCDDEAGQPLRVRRRIVERDESTARHSDKMEATERQEIGEGVKIVRGVSRLRTGRGIGLAPAPTTPIERDDAITGVRKCRSLRLPALARPGDRMHQHDRFTAAATIGEPETNSWQRCELAPGLRFSGRLLRGQANHSRDNDRQKCSDWRRGADHRVPPRISIRATRPSYRTRMNRRVSSSPARPSARVAENSARISSRS